MPARPYTLAALIASGAVAMLAAGHLLEGSATENADNAQPRQDAQSDPFRQVNRPGSVNLGQEYDLSGLTIPRDEIHTLLPRDAIPALTDPKLESAAGADWMEPDDRVITLTIGEPAVAVPLKILNYHEVANMTIDGVPVAATYCPLCDSVTVVERTVTLEPRSPDAEPTQEVLEFGVSGALYNSNVLMYDREHRGLWSQLGFRAVSGPFAGERLATLPVRLESWSTFRLKNPRGRVLSKDTGHRRDYTGNPYEAYFEHEQLLVPVAEHGDQLPMKTLGLGVVAAGSAYFVPHDEIGDHFVIETALGDVVAQSTQAGVKVISAPEDVITSQSLYYAFSAFHPNTRVLHESAPREKGRNTESSEGP